MATVAVTDQEGEAILEYFQLPNGYLVPSYGRPPQTIVESWDKLSDLQCRTDDVLLCSFLKSGSHWVFEVLSMICGMKAERVDLTNRRCHLEKYDQETLEAIPSPRILTTNLPYQYLPWQISEKRIKTVLLLRNPKDIAVSGYNHCLLMSNIAGLNSVKYAGKWENWLPTFMNGTVTRGTPYYSYLLEWEKAIEDGPGFPLHVLYYEDMKEHGTREIKRLMDFLEVHGDSKLIADIEDMCHFQNMKGNLPQYYEEDFKSKRFTDYRNFFRKGEIGDWKNWFTVAQNERFDTVWNERMKTSTLKFRFTPSSNTT